MSWLVTIALAWFAFWAIITCTVVFCIGWAVWRTVVFLIEDAQAHFEEIASYEEQDARKRAQSNTQRRGQRP